MGCRGPLTLIATCFIIITQCLLANAWNLDDQFSFLSFVAHKGNVNKMQKFLTGHENLSFIRMQESNTFMIIVIYL